MISPQTLLRNVLKRVSIKAGANVKLPSAPPPFRPRTHTHTDAHLPETPSGPLHRLPLLPFTSSVSSSLVFHLLLLRLSLPQRCTRFCLLPLPPFTRQRLPTDHPSAEAGRMDVWHHNLGAATLSL